MKLVTMVISIFFAIDFVSSDSCQNRNVELTIGAYSSSKEYFFDLQGDYIQNRSTAGINISISLESAPETVDERILLTAHNFTLITGDFSNGLQTDAQHNNSEIGDDGAELALIPFSIV